MTSLDATETKWSKAGLAIAAFIGAIIVVYLAADHPTKKVTDKVHGVSHTHLVPLSDSYYLVGAIVLAFCLLGYVGLRRQRRTLVVFALFICGFAFTLVFAPLGLALIFLGGWLMLRAYRIQKFGTANAKLAAREAAARRPRRERKEAARAPGHAHRPQTADGEQALHAQSPAAQESGQTDRVIRPTGSSGRTGRLRGWNHQGGPKEGQHIGAAAH